MTHTKITVDVAMEVAAHEAIIRQAYKDSVGVWTWSVGLTNATGHDVTRYIDKPAPLKKCLEVWLWAMEKYADDVREVFKGYELSEAQFAAALSFHWNTGGIKRASWVKEWKAGNIDKAYKGIMNWNKPKEIIPRRRKEQELFFNEAWSNDGRMTEYTRLTSRHSPIWGSAVKIDVADQIADILKPKQKAKPTPKPTPRKKPFWKFW